MYFDTNRGMEGRKRRTWIMGYDILEVLAI